MRQSLNSLSPKFLFAFYNNASVDTKSILRPFIDKRLGVVSSSESQLLDNQRITICQENSTPITKILLEKL